MTIEIHDISENQPPEYTEVFTYAQSLRKAEDADLDVVIPASNELFIDIDTDENYKEYQYNMELIEQHNPKFVHDVLVAPSKSGLPGRHITVQWHKELTDEQRIGLQAILGSDRKREMLSYLSMSRGHEHPTLFYEAKQKALPPAPEPVDDPSSEYGTFLQDSDIPF